MYLNGEGSDGSDLSVSMLMSNDRSNARRLTTLPYSMSSSQATVNMYYCGLLPKLEDDAEVTLGGVNERRGLDRLDGSSRDSMLKNAEEGFSLKRKGVRSRRHMRRIRRCRRVMGDIFRKMNLGCWKGCRRNEENGAMREVLC